GGVGGGGAGGVVGRRCRLGVGQELDASRLETADHQVGGGSAGAGEEGGEGGFAVSHQNERHALGNCLLHGGGDFPPDAGLLLFQGALARLVALTKGLG